MTLGLGRASLVRIPVERAVRDAPRRARRGDRRGSGRRAVGRSPSWRRSGRRRRPRSTRSRPSPTSPSARACGCTSTRPMPASVALLPERRAPFDGWERADSIVVNPHKWLFTPLDASLLLTRRMADPARRRSASCPSTCARSTATTPVHDYNEYTPQLGRRFRALKLWIQLRWFGLEGLRRRIAPAPRAGRGVRRLGRRRPRLGAPGARPVLDGLLPLAPGRPARTEAELDERNAAIMDAVNRTGRGRSCPTPGSTAGSRSASRSATCAPSRGTSSGPGRCCARPRPREPEARRRRTTSSTSPRPTSCATGSTPTTRRPTSCGSATTARRRGRPSVDLVAKRSTRPCASAGSTASATPRRRALRPAVHAAPEGQHLERGQRRKVAVADRRGPDATGRVARVRGADRGEHRDLLVRSGLPRRSHRGGGAVPGQRRRLGRLGATTAVVSAGPSTHWVTSAKRAETRARRLDALIAESRRRPEGGPMRWSRDT